MNDQEKRELKGRGQLNKVLVRKQILKNNILNVLYQIIPVIFNAL